MKILTPILLIIIFFLFSGMLFGYGLFKLTNIANAEEYSPLDFIEQYQTFEVQVGVDNTKGRYYNYHYEF